MKLFADFNGSPVIRMARALTMLPVLAIAFFQADATITAEQREFFETKIRPVLAQDCYECHNSDAKAKGGLVLDHRDALLKGGDSGAVIVPGNPGASLLMRAIRHDDEDLEMPKAGAKLEDEIVANFAEWIRAGAPDPRDAPPSDAEIASDTSWEAVMERRKQWWSFQAIEKPAAPEIRNADWSRHEVDRFILAKLEEAGLAPAERAEKRVLIRRLSFVLTGLPPTLDEIEAFLREYDAAEETDESANRRIGEPGIRAGSFAGSPARPLAVSRVWEKWVDRFLNSPHFGERWARHWMDWVRFAESHGSEGDPEIPNMWRYRDYLVRALNADVPYDQLVREHLAGDMLDHPRVDTERGINESAIGAAHYRLVEHGFGPVDALAEQVRFTENQIDVISKAFLGLTVACARCHNHKFDPISQNDFYALYGIMASCRPATITVDTKERLETNRGALEALKPRLRDELGGAWLASLETSLMERLDSLPEPSPPGKRTAGRNPKDQASNEPAPALQTAVDEATDRGENSPLHAWVTLRGLSGAEFSAGWKKLAANAKARAANGSKPRATQSGAPRWDLRGEDYSDWFSYGAGLPGNAASPGEFHILPDGDQIVANIYPSGVYTHLLSSKHHGVLTSPKFRIETDHLSLRLLGVKGARARLVLQNYPRIASGIYSRNSTKLTSDTFQWYHWNTTYWKGEEAHIELATSDDLPVEAVSEGGRSWFGIAEVVSSVTEDQRPVEADAGTLMLLDLQSREVRGRDDLLVLYQHVLRDCIEAWRDGSSTDAQADFLGFFVRHQLLPNSLADLPGAAVLVAEYRELEAGIPVPTRVPGVLETVAFDQRLMERGDHGKLGEPVPRRFLEAFDGRPYETNLSGRRELAEDVLRPGNPLVARVAVNRIWHYVFGRGICPTVDNFGRMGEKPTHPELLDYLATRLAEHGWSIKDTIRHLVLSKTFCMSSAPSEKAMALDPANDLLSHARVRRLEAEAIRDSLLAVSGRLDAGMFGPGFAANGGASQSPRRSLYMKIIRNELDDFLRAFDAPEPFSAKGRRNVTNVPAQSLTLMNDPFVIEIAKQWGRALAEDPGLKEPDARIVRMFEQALGRPPSEEERVSAEKFVLGLEESRREFQGRIEELRKEIDSMRKRLHSIVGTARARLSGESGETRGGPEPMARWEFEDDFADSIGGLDGMPAGDARIENGALVVDGIGSYVKTAPLERDLRAKTLEVWVLLDNLEQRGGGVMTVQDLNGGTFDAIVYGEKTPRRWLAGSNNHRRTVSFGGPDETEAVVSAPVHVAVVYEEDGTITAYRGGELYGAAYKSSGPESFAAGQAEILFGCRHGNPGGNRMLSGRILEARLYDRALTSEEIAASARGAGDVSEEEVLRSLTVEQRVEKEELETQIDTLEAQLAALRPKDGGAGEGTAWQDLAHAIFNLKEFIYVR